MNNLGAVALVWCLVWFMVVKESPHEDRSISKQELDYIDACLGSTSNQHVSIVIQRFTISCLPIIYIYINIFVISSF